MLGVVVTPYNFIETDGRVWVVDVGHAQRSTYGNINPWLLSILCDESFVLSEWNDEFA